jgi:hypothetical protein
MEQKMAKMKKFMMDDGRFGCALVNCCDVNRIVQEAEFQMFYTSRCSREISFVNEAFKIQRSTTSSLSYEENDKSEI